MGSAVAEREKQHTRTTTLTLESKAADVTPDLPNPAQNVAEYKKHSLAAHYWGEIPPASQPIRQVAADEAQETFLRGFLDTPTDHAQRNPADWLVSLILHIVIIGAVLLAPLAFTQAIDLHKFQLTYLAMPKPPAPPPPPPAAMQQVPKQMIRQLRTSALTAPAVIPSKILQVKDDNPPDMSAGGVVGGIPGGEIGGVLGGIVGGTQTGPPPPPPAPAAKKTVYRVGGDVKPPRAITIVPPIYSPIARAARAEGVVVVDAIIDEHGDVVQARAVSGPGLLMSAAVQAVAQWKYEPTYLDGTPVAIRMEVHVYFNLH